MAEWLTRTILMVLNKKGVMSRELRQESLA